MVYHKKEDTRKMAISELKRYRLRMQIMGLLYEKGLLSASALSKATNVSLPTVRSIIDDLSSENVVKAIGMGDSKGGRKPVIFGLAEDAYYILAVEMGHFRAKVVIFNCLNQEITPIQEIETNIDDAELDVKLFGAYHQVLSQSSIKENQIEAIGVCMPGLIDTATGINHTIKSNAYRNISERLTNRFGKRVYIENDARMQAMGEFIFGKARNTRNALVVNWSWGLGLGMILNGSVYSGATGFAGELSHIRVMENGELCDCGKRGCLQTIASARKLLELAQEEVQKGTVSQLTTRFRNNPHTMMPFDIINSARKGDELSISLLNKISTNLAWGLSILIQLYNPELIVLNGPLTQASQYVRIPLKQALNQYCLENISSNVKIEISEMGEHSGLLGVAVMVFQQIFSDKSMNQ
jgi:predicted NBD/HSP70 family sugar kinase